MLGKFVEFDVNLDVNTSTLGVYSKMKKFVWAMVPRQDELEASW